MRTIARRGSQGCRTRPLNRRIGKLGIYAKPLTSVLLISVQHSFYAFKTFYK